MSHYRQRVVSSPDHIEIPKSAIPNLKSDMKHFRAVATVANKTNLEDTLIIVTADHGHTFSVGGYAKRGTPVLGLADSKSRENLPYPILTYGTGPGAHDVSLAIPT